MQSVSNAKNLNIETTLITNPKLNKNKQLSAGIINAVTHSAVYIETPYLINPFGLSSFDGGNGKGMQEEAKTWSLVLKAAGGQNENVEDIANLFAYLKALDEKAIDFAILHSQTIFKKKYDDSQRSIIVDLLYNRCVKPSIAADGTVYPDKITMKVMKNDQMLPDVLVFKSSPTPIEISSWEMLQNIIPKGSPIKVIMQPRLYFVNGKMGINCRVLQIKLPNVEKVGRPLTYAFSDTISQENASPETVFNAVSKEVVPPSETVVPPSETSVVKEPEASIEDSDEASDSEVEVEDE